MTVHFNRVLLAGNLTRDPEVRFLPNDRVVADFGLAMNRRFKSADGQVKEEVTFIEVECWGRVAENSGKFLMKGSGVFVEGRLKLDTWEDKETKERRSKVKVVAGDVRFQDRRPAKDGAVAGDQEAGGLPIEDEPPF